MTPECSTTWDEHRLISDVGRGKGHRKEVVGTLFFSLKAGGKGEGGTILSILSN